MMVGVPVDFGRTASDYARYRTSFPAELFTRLSGAQVGVAGQRIVDLGTGTGVLARGFAAAGCTVTGVDISPELLDEGRRQGGDVTYRLAPADDTGLPDTSFDVVCAGQSWHWFAGPKAAAEARRLVVDGGRIALCYRDYHVRPGNVCAASEDLVLAYHPDWSMADTTFDTATWTADLERAGFHGPSMIDFDVDVPFTHEQWRGRMRTSNGVGASLSDADVAAFDADLAQLLRERFPHEPLMVRHRIWALLMTAR